MKTIILTIWLPIIGFFFLLILPNAAFTQEDGEEDLHQYFDDGGLSTRKNIVATDFMAPLAGAFTVRYERALSKHLSLEVGVSKLLPIYVFELLPLNSYLSGFEPTGGWGFSAASHYFWDDQAPETHFVGLKYGMRKYALADESTATIHDISWNYGYNLFLSKYFMFCYQAGIGYRRILRTESPFYTGGPYGGSAEKYGTVFLPFMLGVGIMF